jgi:hypothetical protein
VKVGHRQALIEAKTPLAVSFRRGLVFFGVLRFCVVVETLEKVDTTPKTGVYCEAPLIVAKSTRRQAARLVFEDH